MGRPRLPVPPHGTRARYSHRREPCRCDDCRRASATAARLSRRKREGREDAPYRLDPDERFWAKVSKQEGHDACWVWGGRVTAGYGRFAVGGVEHCAHRWIFERTYAVDLAGLEIHHRCENKLCVRPEHLQAVSRRLHSILHHRDWCLRGHILNSDTTFTYADGQRGCIECRKVHKAAYKARWSDEKRELEREKDRQRNRQRYRSLTSAKDKR